MKNYYYDLTRNLKAEKYLSCDGKFKLGVASNEISGKLNQRSVGYLTSDRPKDSRNSNESFPGRSNARARLHDTVLIVNDVQDQLDMMGMLLGQSGYHVITAQDGCEGYEVALAERPDLVISDVSMPRMDGIAMCVLIRENVELKTTPILLVSAVRKDSESAVQGLKAGADDYLEAPYDPMLLVARVAHLIERKRMEEALRQSEERYRRLFENANDIIYTQDLAGNLTSVNKVAETVTGYSIEEVLKMNFSQLFSASDIEKMRMMTKRKLSGKTDSTSYEVTFRAKDGRAIQLDVSTTLIIENGEPVGVQGIARDITERKRADEALRTSQAQLQQSQKLEAIGQLAGGVAHDFNNVLTAITGYSELSLRRLAEDHPVRSYLKEIKKASDRAASLTGQLLAFSRKQILEPKVLDLNLVVSDMYEMLRRLIGEDIDLATSLKSDLGRVKADLSQVEQIIMNLIVNARDAMAQGGKITIETANVTLDERYTLQHLPVQTGHYVMLAVTDTGCGIDKETQTHIFEPFFTTKEAGKGTGLGLSTVYGIVTQSGGYIWAYSEVGKGTSFKIYLPRLADQTLPEKPRSLSPYAESDGYKTILLVEDEAIVRHITRLILETNGYRVLVADGAEKALRLCQQHAGTIDLMITDVIMRGMSGRVLAERVAVVCPELPVLYMSGYTDEAIVRHGLLSDMLEFIQKPFTSEGLALKVRSVLGTHARKIGRS